MLFHEAIERRAVDAGQTCGIGDVSASFPHHVLQILLLELREHGLSGGVVIRSADGTCEREASALVVDAVFDEREVSTSDLVGRAREYDKVLHHVAELADVPTPGPVGE